MTEQEKKKKIYEICKNGITTANSTINLYRSFYEAYPNDEVFVSQVSSHIAFALEVLLKTLIIERDVIKLNASVVEDPEFRDKLDKQFFSGSSIITYLNSNGLIENFDPRFYSPNGSQQGYPFTARDSIRSLLSPLTTTETYDKISGHDICGFTLIQHPINRILLNNGLFLSGNEIDLFSKIIGVFEGSICKILRNKDPNVGNNVQVQKIYENKESFPIDRYAWVSDKKVGDVDFLLHLADIYKGIADYKIPNQVTIESFGLSGIDDMIMESVKNPEIFNKMQKLSKLDGFKYLGDIEKFYSAVYLSDDEINAVLGAIKTLPEVERMQFVSLCVYFKTMIKSIIKENSKYLILDGKHLANINEYMDYVKRIDFNTSPTLEEIISPEEKKEIINNSQGIKSKIDYDIKIKRRSDFIEKLKENPNLIIHHPEYNDDVEIGLIVVSKDGMLLKYLSDRLRGNRTIALAAMFQNIMSKKFINPSLEFDKKLLDMIEKIGWQSTGGIDPQIDIIRPIMLEHLELEDHSDTNDTAITQKAKEQFESEPFPVDGSFIISMLDENIYFFFNFDYAVLNNAAVINYFMEMSDEELEKRMNDDLLPNTGYTKLYAQKEELRQYKSECKRKIMALLMTKTQELIDTSGKDPYEGTIVFPSGVPFDDSIKNAGRRK